MTPLEPDPLDEAAADASIDPAVAVPAAELLALTSAATPSDALRARVVDRALRSRPAGRPVAEVDDIGPIEAFRRALSAIAETVDSLSLADAAALTVEGWTITGLVGHLTAVDLYTGGVLGWWDAPAFEHTDDHLEMTRPAALAAEVTGWEPTRAHWHEVVRAVSSRLDDLEGRLAERIVLHGFDFSIRSLLVARTFEVWTHDEDICRALGRPLRAPDSAQLRVMTATAVAALPIGMLVTGRAAEGRSVRIVLTGHGGGAWVQPLELGATGPVAPPSATLVVDATAFCRVAAKRLGPADVPHEFRGDGALVVDVLAASAVFAA